MAALKQWGESRPPARAVESFTHLKARAFVACPIRKTVCLFKWRPPDECGRSPSAVTTGDIVRKMVLGHVTANDAAFHAAVQEFVAEERRKNHHILAKEIERILWSKERATPDSLTLLRRPITGDAPRDKERNAPLIDVHETRRDLDSLVLRAETRDAIQRILAENRRADLLGTHGLRPSNKILFWGPPGCGKTAAAEVIARELRLPLALVRFDALVSSYLGETAANIRKVFEFARAQPVVLFFDEFDAIGKRRASREEHGELKRTVNAFLQILDSFKADTITIAATNHQDALDPALWRRFDEVVQFRKPTTVEIHELLVKRLRQVGTTPDVDLGTAAKKLRGLSHADVERIGLDATKRAVLAHAKHVSADQLNAAIVAHLAREAHLRKTADRRSENEPGEPSD